MLAIMKRILGLFAFVLLASAPALAGYGSIGGRIVDDAGRPLANVPVAIFALPLHQGEIAASSLTTNRNGYFSKVGVNAGRYLVRADVDGNAVACAVDDVNGGWNTHLVLRVHGSDVACRGHRAHSASVNSSITADEYILH